MPNEKEEIINIKKEISIAYWQTWSLRYWQTENANHWDGIVHHPLCFLFWWLGIASLNNLQILGLEAKYQCHFLKWIMASMCIFQKDEKLMKRMPKCWIFDKCLQIVSKDVHFGDWKTATLGGQCKKKNSQMTVHIHDVWHLIGQRRLLRSNSNKAFILINVVHAQHT